jgi:threonine dehydratase
MCSGYWAAYRAPIAAPAECARRSISHAYDHPLIAAGAGTLLTELRDQIPGLNVVVAVGGGGLFSGVATAAQHHGIRTIAVEPENCRALNAALEAGRVVDVPVESVAADSLGARRVSEMALQAAQHKTVRSVLVPDADIIAARHALWNHRCLAVERAAGTALAGLLSPADYRRAAGEKVCVVLCGANTDPAWAARRLRFVCLCAPDPTHGVNDAPRAPDWTLADNHPSDGRSLRNEKVRGSSPLGSTRLIWL